MRVLSWNVWYRFGDWQRRLEAIRKMIADIRPDVCALQEVWHDDNGGLAAILGEDLRLHWTWGAARNQAYWQERLPQPGIQHGAAVLSRWPIRQTRVEVVSEIHGRTALAVHIDAPGTPLRLLSAHLSAHGGDAFRHQQARRLAQFARKWHDGDWRTLLTGDFNALPGSETMRILSQDYIDLWTADEPGPTWISGDPAVPTEKPTHRIDYILAGRGQEHHRLLGIATCPNASVDGVWPSDHLAIVADFADR